MDFSLAYKPVEDKVHFFSSVFTRAENLQEKSLFINDNKYVFIVPD